MKMKRLLFTGTVLLLLSGCQTMMPNFHFSPLPTEIASTAIHAGKSLRENNWQPPKGWHYPKTDELEFLLRSMAYRFDSTHAFPGSVEFKADGTYARFFDADIKPYKGVWSFEGNILNMSSQQLGNNSRFRTLMDSTGLIILVNDTDAITSNIITLSQGQLIEPESRRRFQATPKPGKLDGVYMAIGIPANPECSYVPFSELVQIHKNEIYLVKARGYDLRPLHLGKLTGSHSAEVTLPEDDGQAKPLDISFARKGFATAVWHRKQCDTNLTLRKLNKSLPYDAAFEAKVKNRMPVFPPPSKNTPEEIRAALMNKVLIHNWSKKQNAIVVRYFKADGKDFIAVNRNKSSGTWKVSYLDKELSGRSTSLTLDNRSWGMISRLRPEPGIFTTSLIVENETYLNWWVGVIGDCWPEKITGIGTPKGAIKCQRQEEDKFMKRFSRAKQIYSSGALKR